jgi:hypothetical protein
VISRTLARFDKKVPYLLVGGLWLLYAVISMFAPRAGTNTYHLSQVQLALLQLTVVLPILLIWLIATYGAVRFMLYCQKIRKSPDGKALMYITDGLLVLTLSYVLQGVLGALRRLFAGQDAVGFVVFIHSHVPMILAVLSIWYIYKGSLALSDLVHAKITGRQTQFIVAPFVFLALIFAWYFYANLEHSVVNGVPNFALPGKLPFFTMAVPYLCAWVLGLLSILYILNYIIKVKGALYKQSLRYLAAGIMAVLTFTIFVQFLTLFTAAFVRLALTQLLILVYFILIFYSLGFVLIAMGARKLARIEDV